MTLPLKALIHKIAGQIIDLVLPQSCIGCKTPGVALCGACKETASARSLCCVLCNFRNKTGAICRECRPKNSMLSHVVSVGLYDGTLKQAIRALKYRGRKTLAKPLGELLAQQFIEWNSGKENVHSYTAVPIPLHPTKEQTRGFNQAALLGKNFAEITGISVAADILKKIKDTAPQARTLVRALRIQNTQGVFAADPAALAPHRDKTIILIDDVATTGATLHDASRALSDAGATRIIGLVVAHG